ncbi:hypothetical protein HELRODRAFT_167642 [Helobdella robusta]|uniref:SH3 domain-containing protein n=1 Tax=Helobdella robusta TaxID=6412 RepID=T1EZL7_HELRO|nr:hypothetical protein HELRODRAFT_167642 [Helobdella robusta]ESO09832.1 hypothetical protein HELRODRAFT_167642 [Helobdella robusta]
MLTNFDNGPSKSDNISDTNTNNICGMPRTTSPIVTLLKKKRGSSNKTPVADNIVDITIEATNGAKIYHDVSTQEAGNHAQHNNITAGNYIQQEGQQQKQHVPSQPLPRSKVVMDVIKENLEQKPRTESRRKPWNPPNATYSYKKYCNEPNKLDNYEPGTSSVLRLDPFAALSYNPPVEKPGDHCKYLETKTPNKYCMHKNIQKPKSIGTPHHVYMKVQHGGEIPINGLFSPPEAKPGDGFLFSNIRLASGTGRRHSDATIHPNNPARTHSNNPTSTHPNDLHPRHTSSSPRSNIVHKIFSNVNTNQSLSALLSSANEDMRNRKSREEIHKARKKEMEHVLNSLKEKKRLMEIDENRARRHSDFYRHQSKSPVILDRYNFDDVVWRSNTCTPTSPYRLSRRARVLYNFYAKDIKELTLRKNDIVLIWKAIDNNWYEGEHHGAVGIFPANYVQMKQQLQLEKYVSCPSVFMLREKENFQYKRQKPLVKMVQIKKAFTDWYLVRTFSHCITSIPRMQTSETGDAKANNADTIESHSLKNASVAPNLNDILLTTHSQIVDHNNNDNCSNVDRNTNRITIQVNNVYKSDDGKPTNAFISNASKNLLVVEKDNWQSGSLEFQINAKCLSPKIKLASWADEVQHYELLNLPQEPNLNAANMLPFVECIAVQSYEPQDLDELHLTEGDIVHVTEIFDDGWYVGISQRSKLFGTFPGNFVRKLK